MERVRKHALQKLESLEFASKIIRNIKAIPVLENRNRDKTLFFFFFFLFMSIFPFLFLYVFESFLKVLNEKA